MKFEQKCYSKPLFLGDFCQLFIAAIVREPDLRGKGPVFARCHERDNFCLLLSDRLPYFEGEIARFVLLDPLRYYKACLMFSMKQRSESLTVDLENLYTKSRAMTSPEIRLKICRLLSMQ